MEALNVTGSLSLKEDHQLQSSNLQLEIERTSTSLALDGGQVGQRMDQNDRPQNDVGLGDKCLSDQVILGSEAPGLLLIF